MYKLLMIFLSFVIMAGCSISFTSEDKREGINLEIEEGLSIGVVGDIPDYENDKVDFTSVNPESLKEEEYDAYFVTDAYFEELASGEWYDVFTSISVPVFFINTNKELIIFLHEDFNYGTGFEATSHSTGLANDNEKRHRWGFGAPDQSTDVNDTPDIIFELILKTIVEYYE
ncbi:hypothetical protein [Salipaludibacillus daqingensis]|uniref:hypothetical protein n=1 Tax=Salipaludibacillus daqingensis TaxID=3041001 RepID=UPI002475276F|nr:hypothetical protein [Salipaludibacillus daqingensis]